MNELLIPAIVIVAAWLGFGCKTIAKTTAKACPPIHSPAPAVGHQ